MVLYRLKFKKWEKRTLKKIIKYLKDYKKESIIGPLFKMLEAIFELLVPVIMAQVIDIGIKNNDHTYIYQRGFILILLGLIGLVCSLTAQYFAAVASVGFGTKIRKDMFAHINRLSYSELDMVGTSTLITRITSDINQVQSGVNMGLRLFLRSPFIVIGALIMAFTIHVKIALIFLLSVPILSIIIYGIMFYCIPLYKKVQSKLDRVSQKTRENLVGVRVIRSFSKQKTEIQEFDTLSEDLLHTQASVGRISALMNPLTYIVVNLAIIAIIWYGGIEVNTGRLTQGEVIALVNYMMQILMALITMSLLIVSLTKATASIVRVNEVFDKTTSIIDGEETRGNIDSSIQTKASTSLKSKVCFKDVSFSYENDSDDSLSNISFSVAGGETIGIIGGTGAGKSTLVNLIPRFYDVSKGAVLVDGIDVKEYKLSTLRGKVGMVPQKAVLFKGSIRDNMKWGKKDATDEEIYEALDIAQAREFVDSKPNGLDEEISQGGKNLSGGQRQRLTIARALVKKPEILILDDSASALDYATDAKLRKAIATQTKGMTVFIVSQRATTIKNADRIVVLDDGKMVGFAKHEELLETCKVYKEICLSQLSNEEVNR